MRFIQKELKKLGLFSEVDEDTLRVYEINPKHSSSIDGIIIEVTEEKDFDEDGEQMTSEYFVNAEKYKNNKKVKDICKNKNFQDDSEVIEFCKKLISDKVTANFNLVVADATLGNDSVLSEAMFKLLKNTRELEYMAHQFHWNIVGVKFNTMHEFYEEEYKQLFEDQDEIAEQIRQQGFFVPVIDNFVLEENYKASGFEEQLVAYASKLTQNIALIDKVNEIAKNEIAIQDMCARLKGLRSLSLNLKVKAMLGVNKMSLEPSEATAAADYIPKADNGHYDVKVSVYGKDGSLLHYNAYTGYYKTTYKENVKAALEEYDAKRRVALKHNPDNASKWIDAYRIVITSAPANAENTERVYDTKLRWLKNEDWRKFGKSTSSAVTAELSDSTRKELENLGFKVSKSGDSAMRENEDGSLDSVECTLYFSSARGRRPLMNGNCTDEQEFNKENDLINHIKNKSKATAAAEECVVYVGDEVVTPGKSLTLKEAKKVADKLKKQGKKEVDIYDLLTGKLVTASAVTAGFDKGRYKEITKESEFFKILKDDCDIRAKNFYAINRGLRLAIRIIKGTFEEASVRYFILKKKGGYVRVELKDKVYIVGYTIYDSGKIKVWTRELKSNVPVNSFDYAMLNMYAKPFGTKMITGMLPTWMSI